MRAAGILRQVGVHNTARADGEPSSQKAGYGLNVSGTWKVLGQDQVNWQVVGGKAIASYMNDGGVDLAPDANLRRGGRRHAGLAALLPHAVVRPSGPAPSATASTSQSNTDGQLATAFRRGSYGSLNALYALTRNVTSGVEYIWGKNETKDGTSAIDYRLPWSTRVTF